MDLIQSLKDLEKDEMETMKKLEEALTRLKNIKISRNNIIILLEKKLTAPRHISCCVQSTMIITEVEVVEEISDYATCHEENHVIGPGVVLVPNEEVSGICHNMAALEIGDNAAVAAVLQNQNEPQIQETIENEDAMSRVEDSGLAASEVRRIRFRKEPLVQEAIEEEVPASNASNFRSVFVRLPRLNAVNRGDSEDMEEKMEIMQLQRKVTKMQRDLSIMMSKLNGILKKRKGKQAASSTSDANNDEQAGPSSRRQPRRQCNSKKSTKK